MTTIYPDAKWRPLGGDPPARMSSHDLILLHTMVGSLWGTDGYFRGDGSAGVESHFGVGYDGEVLQWVDLDCKADANYQANENAISVETADMGTGFPDWGGTDVPAWTEAQLRALAEIVAWCCNHYSIPCVAIPDSKPGRRGIGWHRQGVESSPPYQSGYRVPGGEWWSIKVGKVCPGSRRIAQIPEVINRAQAIQAGDDEGKDWSDMATKEEVEEVVRVEVGRGLRAFLLGQPNGGYTPEQIAELKEIPPNGVLAVDLRRITIEVQQSEVKIDQTNTKLDQLLAGE